MLPAMRVYVDARAGHCFCRLFAGLMALALPVFLLTPGMLGLPERIGGALAVAVGGTLALWLPMMLWDFLGASLRFIVQVLAAPRRPSVPPHICP